jgi:hypothetical protein
MIDISQTIKPKSDQLNADDLIGGPRVIHIRDVKAGGSPEQPISIYFDGDDNKPYKPCLSMRRLLVAAWGKDGQSYIGRHLNLYNDPSVAFGKVEVGGIRISHASHIDKPLNIALTVSKARRKPYVLHPLTAADIPQEQSSVIDEQDLIENATNAATCGLEIYKNWFGNLSNQERAVLVNNGHHEKCKTAAQNADNEGTQ